MRTFKRLLGSVLAVILVLTTFSSMALADSDLEDSGSKAGYDYEFYSDGRLYINCTDSSMVDLRLLSPEVLYGASEVIIDVSDAVQQYGVTRFTFYGDTTYLLAGNARIVGPDKVKDAMKELLKKKYID